MSKRLVTKICAVLSGGVGGAVLGWLIGDAIYFFTEDLLYRSAPEGERLMHAVDGGLAVGILTFLFLMPIGAITGSLIGKFLITK